MKKFLLAFILFFFLFPTTAKASCSFSEQFCEDYGIESYEELEEIYTIYSATLGYGMDSYSKVEDAIISDYILKEELGEDLVGELLDFQEQYGYGSIEKLLNAADEIGYGELTGDYSYIQRRNENYESNAITEDAITNENSDIEWHKKFINIFSNIWKRNWYFLLPIISWGLIFLCIAFNSWRNKRK